MGAAERCLMISIHALREEGDATRDDSWTIEEDISIHALREEGDTELEADCCNAGIFLSTPSARRATSHGCLAPFRHAISIHALREEGDVYSKKVLC